MCTLAVRRFLRGVVSIQQHGRHEVQPPKKLGTLLDPKETRMQSFSQIGTVGVSKLVFQVLLE